VGEWADLTTTYSDPNGSGDIAWAFFFLERAWPIDGGGLVAGYYQPSGLFWLMDSGYCQPGQAQYLSTGVVTFDCLDSNVSSAGDTLTIHWRVRPEQCFDGSCGWNFAYEGVSDHSGLEDQGIVGWWELGPTSGQTGDSRPAVRPMGVVQVD